MRGDIRNIRYLAKYGAYGRSDAIAFYIYGKRRDGRTVPCKSEVREDGEIQIFSSYLGSDRYLEEDMTELTAAEWNRIKNATGQTSVHICNDILDARRRSHSG